ncbi:MAG: hypothetical protein HY393_03940 [Candidatus Diapherotrites archaeon]|nr:hypothetical protein [Candidatus Diapherotrites archaeon]
MKPFPKPNPKSKQEPEYPSRHVRVCPQCGSMHVKEYMGGVLGQKFQCMECGYIGPVLESLKGFFREGKK